MRAMHPVQVRRRSIAAVAAVLGGLLGIAAVAGPVLAHGPVPPEPPTVGSLLFGWTFAPLPTLAIAVAAGWWYSAVRRVNVRHPANPVPRRRTVAFAAALVALGFALASGIERYDTTLFSVHMVQHVLLVLVAAPLLAMAAPITLVLRVVSPDTRRRWILPVLHSRVLRMLTFPVTAWVLFAAVMWGTHFSGFFDVALEAPPVHDLEHGLFLVSALLFWWPAVAADPAPWRLAHPARIGYVFLQMTQNTFLAFVLLNVSTVLYPHYATLGRPYRIDPLADQRLAAGVMWIAGDLIFLTAIMLLVAGWMRSETRGLVRADRQADLDLARIRVRERRLAERLADERGEPRRS
jgi:cytochrome c oxidase assembly factor CtaG